MKITKQYLKQIIKEELLKEQYIEPPNSYSSDIFPKENVYVIDGKEFGWMQDPKDANSLQMFQKGEGFINYGTEKKNELVDELNKLGIKHNIK